MIWNPVFSNMSDDDPKRDSNELRRLIAKRRRIPEENDEVQCLGTTSTRVLRERKDEYSGEHGYANLQLQIQLEHERHGREIDRLNKRRAQWLKENEMIECPNCKEKIKELKEHLLRPEERDCGDNGVSVTAAQWGCPNRKNKCIY